MRIKHFAHKNQDPCAAETLQHATAKLLIAQVLAFKLSGKSRRSPVVDITCPGVQIPDRLDPTVACGRHAAYSMERWVYDEVLVEVSTRDGLRPDVLMRDKGTPVFAIEVVMTHSVDASKAERTTIPWIELDAADVLASPYRWKPRQMDFLRELRCERCSVVEDGQQHPCLGGQNIHEWIAQCLLTHYARARPLGYPSRARVSLGWDCPRCHCMNAQCVFADSFDKVDGLLASNESLESLDRGIRLWSSGRPVLEILFRRPEDPLRPCAIRPLPGRGIPTLVVRPDYRRLDRLILLGTNLIGRFICKRCRYDAWAG